MIRKLKPKDIAVTRAEMLLSQNNKCAICGEDISDQPMRSAVLDHNHKTGFVRAVLHRGCNALLGKIENTMRMNGLDEDRIHLFLIGTSNYLIKHETQQTDLLHSTYKTVEEKKEATKRKRKRRK